MPRNIELKVRCADLGAAEATCERLGAQRQWTRRQTDLYFAVPDGRLKLRTETPGEAMLVAYHRPDAPAPRDSHYEVTPVRDADAERASLEAEFGIRTQVDKTRTLYLLEHVRIHLDDVAGLGTFIEFEAVMDPGRDDAATHALLARLRAEFAIADEDLLPGSYSDMLPPRH